MNGKKIIELQNTFGRFIQLFDLVRLDLASALFAEDARLWLPDFGIDAKGAPAVNAALQKIQGRRMQEGCFRNEHIPHSAAYRMVDEKTAQGSWLVYSFIFSEKGDGWSEFVNERIDADFVWEDGRMKILELDWWEVGSFEPVQYTPEEQKVLQKEYAKWPLPPAFTGRTSASDFYAIQNVFSRFVQNNRKYAMENTFSATDDISMALYPVMERPAVGREAVQAELKRLEEMEKANKGKYLYAPISASPVIEVSNNGSEAKAQWLSYLIGIKGEAFGITASPYELTRKVGLVTADYVLENGKWRIHDLAVNVVMTLPKMAIDLPNSEEEMSGYCRIGLDENKWDPAWPKLSGDYPDDMPEIESQIAYWLCAYRRGEHAEYVYERMANKEQEVSFKTRTVSRTRPATIGVKALAERFSMNTSLYHHQQVPTHGLLSPDVEITEDGRYATLSGYDVSTVAYVPGRNGNNVTLDLPDNWDADHSPISRVPCLHGMGRYDFKLVKIDGVWKHYGAEYDSMTPFEEIYLAGKNSRGWSGAVSDVKYPFLWEKYQYREERKNGQPVDYENRPI